MTSTKSKTIANLPQANSSSIAAMDPLVAMIERAARDPSIDMDRLERLMQMQERAQQRTIEAQFNEAMAEAQMEMRAVAADANNPQTKSKYASYFALDKAIRPIYSKHGLALSFNTAEGASADCVRVVCYVSRSGFTRQYHVDMPADGKGAKGGDVMTKTHAVGAAMTYGQRYLLKMIFNIAVGEDKDGNKIDTSDIVTEQQVTEIRNLLNSDAEEPALCKHLGIARLGDMTEVLFEKAKKAIDAKRKQTAAAPKSEELL